jgi:membrane protease YdiL (CAAX protease family)
MLVASLLRAGGPLAEAYPPDAPEPAKTWFMLWATVLSLPARLLAGVLLIRATCDARLSDMGITTRHLVRDVMLGAALALPLAGAVYGVNVGCEALMKLLSGGAVQEHVFNDLAQQKPTPAEWHVMITSALLAAPLWEEFLFRGLVQPWAIASRWAGPILLGLAVFLAVAFRYDAVRAAWGEGPKQALVALLPALVALSLVPLYLLLKNTCRSPVPAGVFAAAVLFGWFHVRFWPSPVPLTLLGVGLGWLTYRTRSLAGPVVMHATFNAIAVAMLLFGGSKV